MGWGCNVKTIRIYDTETGEHEYWTKGGKYKNKTPKSIELLEKSLTPFVGPYKRDEHAIVTDQLRVDFNKVEAWSYNWWLFMKLSKDGKTLYVNDAHYSNQTSTHQWMLDNILKIEDPKAFGLKVKKVYIREGLQGLDKAIANRVFRYAEAMVKFENTRKDPQSWLSYANSHLKAIVELQALQKDLGYKITRVKKSELAEAVVHHTFDRLDELAYKRERAAKQRAEYYEANKERLRKELVAKLILKENSNEDQAA